MRRTWPAANGILKPSGAVVGNPCTQYVQKFVVLALLSIADDGRSGGLELLDGVANGVLVQRIHGRIGAIRCGYGAQQLWRPWNAADRFGRDVEHGRGRAALCHA